MRAGPCTLNVASSPPFVVSPSSTSLASWDGRLSVSRDTYVDGEEHALTKAEDSITQFGKDHENTKLIINHHGVDPEDTYSQVPYEKGFHFIYYLERLVGRANFDKFIPHYFTTWSGKSLDSWEFKDTFMNFFNGLGDEDLKKKVAEIDWNDKLYTPGLPPKPEFDTTLADQCFALADKWKSEVSSCGEG
jgi:aminopeptidase N